MIRPFRGSTRVSSDRAMPMPITIPPRSWLAAVFALITVPTSNDPSQRDTRTSPVSGSTRTSQNCAPHAAFTQRRRSSRNFDMNRSCPATAPAPASAPTPASTYARPAWARISVYVAPGPVRSPEPAIARLHGARPVCPQR